MTDSPSLGPILAAVCILGAFGAFTPSCAAGAISAEDRSFARKRFETHCATCHGLDGEGHGPSSTSLNPPPGDWTDEEWQADVTDEYLEFVIAQGGEAAGLSSGMPASKNADRLGVIKALVEIVRSFGK